MKVIRYTLTIVLPLALFIIIAVNVIGHNAAGFDNYVYSAVSKLISPGLTEFMILITFFGSGEFFTASAIILIIVFIALLKKGKYSFYTAMIVINLALAALLNTGIKYIVHRSRPDILRLIAISGYSFPSGHSMISMSFYGLLIYLCYISFKTRWKYLMISLLAFLVFLIGLSRIYLGVHYASDVLAGFSLGIFWVGIFSLIIGPKCRKYKETIVKS